MSEFRSRRPKARSVLVAVAVATGVVAGLLLALAPPSGVSYLSDDPEACLNCHVMRPQYESWRASAHAEAVAPAQASELPPPATAPVATAAVCNDCHTPAGLFQKAAAKATSGLGHALALATGRFEEPIRIRPDSAALVELNCARCHAAQAGAADHGGVSRAERECLECHGDAGHADRECDPFC